MKFIQANPHKANIRYKNSKEITVANRILCPVETSVNSESSEILNVDNYPILSKETFEAILTKADKTNWNTTTSAQNPLTLRRKQVTKISENDSSEP